MPGVGLGSFFIRINSLAITQFKALYTINASRYSQRLRRLNMMIEMPYNILNSFVYSINFRLVHFGSGEFSNA